MKNGYSSIFQQPAWFVFLQLIIGLSNAQLVAAQHVTAGPLWQDFKLTLESGTRTEGFGPLYYQTDTSQHSIVGFPPFYTRTINLELEYQETDILYPLLTHDRFGGEHRIQLLQVLSYSGGRDQAETDKKRFTIFPIYFQQRSTNAEYNYTAVFPFYGHLKNRVLRDEVTFAMFPLYSKTRKRDIVTRNYVYPFFHLREGNSLRGWQFWPVAGKEVRLEHTRTNGFGDDVHVPGQREFFAMWPFYLHSETDLGTTNPIVQTASLPLFSMYRSPNRDSTTVVWPFFNYADDREKKYREWGFPWPLWVIARGEGKHMNRVWPFFSQASNATQRSEFYAWPLLKMNRANAEPLEQKRTRIFFFLYSDLFEKNTLTGQSRQRKDLWPLFTWKKTLEGGERLQILAPFEPLLPNNKSIERDWSHVWSIWRSEKNLETGHASQSFLWNLWRRETSPDSEKSSLLFGLIQYQSGPDGRVWKWFHFPRRKPVVEAPEPESTVKPIIGVAPIRDVTQWQMKPKEEN